MLRAIVRTFALSSLIASALLLVFGTHLHSSVPPAESSAFLGYDRNVYPGDDALPILRRTFSFSSFWLGPPPGEKLNNWEGKRALLVKHGFGFLVLFNGRLHRDLHSADDARAKGETDARTAARLAEQEGFAPGSTIFLDIEEGGRLSDTYHVYLHAWFDTLLRNSFRPGVYCSGVPLRESGSSSITTAADILAHLESRGVAFWIFNDVCPPSPGCVFSNPPSLNNSGFPQAVVWQYAQSPRVKDRTRKCSTTYAADGNCYAPGDTAHQWILDANVASSADPSAPKK